LSTLPPSRALRAVLGVAAWRRLFAGSGLLYLLLYLWSVQDISRGGRAFWIRTTRWERMFERMGGATFEPVAQLTAPGVTLLVSPLNIMIGMMLGAVVGLGLTLTAVAWRRPDACSIRPVVVGAPTLLAGLACLVPGATIVLKIPVPASFVPVLQVLIPAALLVLVTALLIALARMSAATTT